MWKKFFLAFTLLVSICIHDRAYGNGVIINFNELPVSDYIFNQYSDYNIYFRDFSLASPGKAISLGQGSSISLQPFSYSAGFYILFTQPINYIAVNVIEPQGVTETQPPEEPTVLEEPDPYPEPRELPFDDINGPSEPVFSEQEPGGDPEEPPKNTVTLEALQWDDNQNKYQSFGLNSISATDGWKLLSFSSNGPIDGVRIWGTLDFYIDNLSTQTTNPIPEPATMLLLGFGLIGLVGVRRKLN